jgi:hypothetical protein
LFDDQPRLPTFQSSEQSLTADSSSSALDGSSALQFDKRCDAELMINRGHRKFTTECETLKTKNVLVEILSAGDFHLSMNLVLKR